MTREIFAEDIDALIAGLVIYGTGGGGSEDGGRSIMNNDFRLGRKLVMVDLEDVEDDALICSGGITCSVKPSVGMDFDAQTAAWEQNSPLVKAFSFQEKLKGKSIDYLVPFETGALNTPVILSTAARMGIPMIDADFLGRAAPETHMAAPIGHGVSLYPMGLVDDSGNGYLIMESDDPTCADEAGRILMTKYGSSGGNSHYPMTGAKLKTCCVPGSIFRCLELGKKVIAANERKEDGVDVVKSFTGSWELFRGRITLAQGENKGGFYLMNYLVQGNEEFAGRTARMVVKNELMMLEVDGSCRMMFPDFGFMVYPVTGRGIPSIELREGLDIVLLGAPAYPVVRDCMYDEIGRKSFAGDRYGYPELIYAPIEELREKEGNK